MVVISVRESWEIIKRLQDISENEGHKIKSKTALSMIQRQLSRLNKVQIVISLCGSGPGSIPDPLKVI